ncbi:MAG: glutamate--tRNA ligase family protein [Campylobacterota bacterium]
MLRFAIAPTADMHIEHLQVAIYSYILAKQQNKEFIVRIDDGDVAKNIEGKDGEILAILQKFGLNDDQLYYQSKNKHIHGHMALKLVEQKKAFACFCSEQEIAQQKAKAKEDNKSYNYSGKCEFLTQQQILKSDKKYVVRIMKPKADIVFDDAIKATITATPKEVDSFVILQNDATPTDDFASAIDDMVHGVSYVCNNYTQAKHTPKQIHVRNMLDYEKSITYAHLPRIQTRDEKDVAEDKTASIKWLLAQGFLPNAIINYLVQLHSKTPQEVFDLHDAIAWFDIGTVADETATFDLEKLRSLNRAHIKKTDNRELAKYFGFSEEDIGKLAKIFAQEAATLKEIDSKIAAIFKPKDFENGYKTQMQTLQEIILQAPLFHTYEEFEHYLLQKSALGDDQFSKALRLLMTGMDRGPRLCQLYPYIKSYLTQIVR